MSRATFAPAAIADIDKIWDYTAERWGPDKADIYTDNIRDVSHGLATGEKRGQTVDIRGGYLKYPAGRHFIFFRIANGGIEVIRILHRSMDAARHI